MSRETIPISQLDKLHRQGFSVPKLRRKWIHKGGCIEGVERMDAAVARDVATRSAPQVVEQKIDAMEQLRRANDIIHGELNYLQQEIHGADKKDRLALQDAQLKHVAEIRKQLGLFLDIAQTLYNAEEIARFQQIVMEEINVAAPRFARRYSSALTTEGLLDQLCSSLNVGIGLDEEIKPLGDWAESLPVILDGQPFTFKRHEYLMTPYADSHPHQVFLKAAQLGLTTLGMLRVLYSCRYRVGFRGCLYLFPSRSDVIDFSRGRVSPLIAENPETIGAWIRDTDSAGMKAVWNSQLYLRGMVSRVGLKSVPVDFIVFDELDEAPQDMVTMAMERMGHSEYKEVLFLSNPTLPDYGIDRAFRETDQRFWLLKCSACGAWTDLVETFPSCLLETGGRVIRACRKCQGELDPSRGEWVAKHPTVTERRGYQFSQLFSHFVDPAEILHQFRTTNNLTNFYNLKIGIPWVEATNRLTVEEVLSLCGSDGIVSSDTGPCFAGIDQGKDLHVVIGKRHPGKAGRIVHLGIYRGLGRTRPADGRFSCLKVCCGCPARNEECPSVRGKT